MSKTVGELCGFEKRAYGLDYLPEAGQNLIGLLERANATPTEKGLSEFRESILRDYPTAQSLRLNYDRYDPQNGVEILQGSNLAKVLGALAAARAANEDGYTDTDEVPFFDLKFRAETPEHQEWLQELR